MKGIHFLSVGIVLLYFIMATAAIFSASRNIVSAVGNTVSNIEAEELNSTPATMTLSPIILTLPTVTITVPQPTVTITAVPTMTILPPTTTTTPPPTTTTPPPTMTTPPPAAPPVPHQVTGKFQDCLKEHGGQHPGVGVETCLLCHSAQTGINTAGLTGSVYNNSIFYILIVIFVSPLLYRFLASKLK